MHPYIIIFSLPALLHLINYFSNKNKNQYILIFIIFFIFLFSAFRGDVGGDHKLYVFRFFEKDFNIENIFQSREFIYYQFTWVIKIIFNDFFYFKIFSSILFFVPLYIFLRKTNSDLIGLIIILPFGIFLLHFGYIKQSIAFSITLLLFLSINQNKIIDSILLFIFAIFTHITSFIYIFPLLFIILFKFKIFQNYEKIIILFFYTLLLFLLIIFIYLIKSENIINYLFIFPEFISRLIKVYLINLTHYGKEMTSIGILYRLIPSVFAIILSIYFYKKNILNCNTNLFYFYNFIFIIVIIFSFSGFSTFADRLHFYFILFQILILSRTNKLFLSIKNKILSDIFIILLVLIPMIFWLYFSKFSIKNWQPYHLGI